MWLPIHDEEWDGDVPLGLARLPDSQGDSESGTVTFKANTLPWLVGHYEVYNVALEKVASLTSLLIGAISP